MATCFLCNITGRIAPSDSDQPPQQLFNLPSQPHHGAHTATTHTLHCLKHALTTSSSATRNLHLAQHFRYSPALYHDRANCLQYISIKLASLSHWIHDGKGQEIESGSVEISSTTIPFPPTLYFQNGESPPLQHDGTAAKMLITWCTLHIFQCSTQVKR